MGVGNEHNHPRSKSENRNKEETTNGENPGVKKPRKDIRSHRSKYHQQDARDRMRISGAEDIIENIDTTVKENAKCKNILTQNIQKIQDTVRRPNLRIIGVEESEDSQLKEPVNIFNKIIEENFPNLKREMPMNTQEAYRTTNRLDQKRNFYHHIIVKTPIT